MEERSASPARSLSGPTGTVTAAVGADRDQALVELNFIMDERDRIEKQARIAAAERDRLMDLLRDFEAERDAARDELAAAITERNRLSGENAVLRADLDAAGCMIARTHDEIAWLRALTERLARPASDRPGDE